MVSTPLPLWEGLGVGLLFLSLCYNLWTANDILFGETLLNLDVHAVGNTDCYRVTLVCLLFAFPLYEIDEGAVTAKLNGTFWDSEYVLGCLEYDLGICTIARAETLCTLDINSTL